MKKTAIFYGPSLGSVAKVAKLVADQLGEADLITVKDATPSMLDNYTNLVFGISTIGRANWDSAHKDTDWDVFMTHLDEAHWTGKTVAIFGLGDQLAYPDNFADAIGWLAERLEKFNVKTVGHTSAKGYEFGDSEGFKDGEFLGLPIDEDNEPNLTPERVKNWVAGIKQYGF